MKWTIGSETRSRIDSLLYFAAADPALADSGDRWDLDPWLLGVPNGVVDLRAGRLRPGHPDDRITMQTTVAYRADAPCPRWEQFLREVFVDPALVDFAHRGIGYSTSGETSEQILFLGHGRGSNGKGTYINTLFQVLGDYAYTMPFSTIEIDHRAAIPNDVAALMGRRFVIASETNDGTRLNESRIKALTGCDPITARFLHSEFFTFRPVAKFWLAVNHQPIVRDDSHGFWRRIRLIPFTQCFAVNPTLADELLDEAEGILAWAVRGCLAWQRHGLCPPERVRTATDEFERESDPLSAFLFEACELEPESRVGASDLYDHYKRWAEKARLTDKERLTSTMFGRKIGERFGREHTRSGKDYVGIARSSTWD